MILVRMGHLLGNIILSCSELSIFNFPMRIAYFIRSSIVDQYLVFLDALHDVFTNTAQEQGITLHGLVLSEEPIKGIKWAQGNLDT